MIGMVEYVLLDILAPRGGKFGNQIRSRGRQGAVSRFNATHLTLPVWLRLVRVKKKVAAS